MGWLRDWHGGFKGSGMGLELKMYDGSGVGSLHKEETQVRPLASKLTRGQVR